MALGTAISTLARAGKLARIAWSARRAARAPAHKKQAARAALKALLANARGVPLKIGQMLSNISDDSMFEDLAQGVAARPWSTMRRVLERNLDQPIEAVFAQVDPQGLAASLGQVHRGVLHDGTEVAIKLRYPDISDAVNAEMRLAGWLPGLGPVARWGFDLSGYKATLAANMTRELDYRGEMERQQRFARQVRVDGLVVPRIHQALCSDEVLVQSWEAGLPLDRINDWPVEDRRQVASVLLRTFFTSLFVTGELHGDPHLGNLCVRRDAAGDPQVVLYDFGCTIAVNRHARLAMLKLVLGARHSAATDPLACFTAMGFDPHKLEPIADMLPALGQLLCEPFLSDAPFFVKHWHLSERMNLLLGELKWWFRSAGPSDMLLLVRAWSGLIHQLDLLGAGLSWWPPLLQTIGPHLRQEAKDYHLPVPSVRDRAVADFSSLAKLLRIRVTEGLSQVVDVAMPASEVVRLRELIPPDVLENIAASKIDLDGIVRRACSTGLAPQLLFDLDAGERHYDVRLE